MNCQIFETVVHDLAREQMMEAGARELALAHSGDCEACALRLALERRLTFGLRALAEEMKSESASSRVEQELLEAFRGQTSFVPETRPANRRRYWLVAAAAVVLIAFGIAAMRWRLDGPSPSAVKSTDNTKEQTSRVTTAVNEHSTIKPTPEVTPRVYQQPRRKQPVGRSTRPTSSGNETLVARETNSPEAGNSDQSEVTTEFLPLSYVSPANLQDGGQLVRVELPRSAMVRFGLPVNIERYGEKVKADVLVSADGLARAIRFVQ